MRSIRSKIRFRAAEVTLAASLLLALPLQASAWFWGHHEEPGDAPDIVTLLQDDGRFTTLLTALTEAGLVDTVAEAESITVFAPTDDAFGSLPPGTVEALLGDIPALQNILLYHVLGGERSARWLEFRSTVDTLQGNPVLVLEQGHDTLVNGIPFEDKNLRAQNAYVHVIGQVLIPPDPDVTIESLVDVLAFDGRFETLIDLVVTAGLADALINGESLTLFAPTDDAFDALPEGTIDALKADIPKLQSILLYHVLDTRKKLFWLSFGGQVETLQGDSVSIVRQWSDFYVNGVPIINPNVRAPNGLIHTIGEVLLPPDDSQSLFDVLEANGYNTLIAAIEAAGLTDALMDLGPATILAPTDEAFAELPEETLTALLSDPDALEAVLLYHVIPGEQSSRDLSRQFRVETLNGRVYVWRFFGTIFVNWSRMIQPDVVADGAVVHGIDRVLIPHE